MSLSTPRVTVVLIVGPQASGKSTTARTLTESLRSQGKQVALVSLDDIADMALPTLPSWDAANRVFAAAIEEWARTGVTCVVAEGISSKGEIDVIKARVPASAALVTIVMTTGLEAASRRASADPSRGISRDARWLADRYAEWQRERAQISRDLELDMGSLTVQQGIALAMSAIDRAHAGTTAPIGDSCGVRTRGPRLGS